jgi:hypothetical protein
MRQRATRVEDRQVPKGECDGGRPSHSYSEPVWPLGTVRRLRLLLHGVDGRGLLCAVGVLRERFIDVGEDERILCIRGAGRLLTDAAEDKNDEDPDHAEKNANSATCAIHVVSSKT